MNHWKDIVASIFLGGAIAQLSLANPLDLERMAKQAMKKATQYMVEEVSTNGGYVKLYLPDLSRRWGELETFDTQIWVGGNYPFTPHMGDIFLDAYQATGDEYYYQAAEGVARALIWGQLESGGWDYIIDFAGHRSLLAWYNTIGENAWGWFEYNHYYGTATQHSNTTAATRFLLRLYGEKRNQSLKPALDKAIDFVLQSQFPAGGWSKRYPKKHQYPYNGLPDYTGFYNFHADVPRDNIELLIQCYVTLGEARFLEAINRGMNFFLVTQQGNGGWAKHYDMDLRPANGRPFEPAGISPVITATHIRLLLRFYTYTGDRKFLTPIPAAIEFLERTRLPKEMTNGGKRTHAGVVEIGTEKPLWNHRRGTGVGDGDYWVSYDHEHVYAFGDNIKINIESLKKAYDAVSALSPEEATVNSPLKIEEFKGENPQRYGRYRENYRYYDLTPHDIGPDFYPGIRVPDEIEVKQIVGAQDELGRWLTTHAQISSPFSISETGEASNTALHSDPITADAILDESGQEYLDTRTYIRYMNLLINYIGRYNREKTNAVN